MFIRRRGHTGECTTYYKKVFAKVNCQIVMCSTEDMIRVHLVENQRKLSTSVKDFFSSMERLAREMVFPQPTYRVFRNKDWHE